MSDRLISADALKERLSHCSGCSEYWIDIEAEIDAVPTAYDVDKVIEQIDKASYKSYREPMLYLRDVLKIVKGGLKDE